MNKTTTKNPPPNRGKVKRSPVKIKRTRQAVKIKRDAVSPFHEIFGSLIPPSQMNDHEGMGVLKPTDVDPQQLEALRRENFLMWACTSGIEVDHKPFDIDNHKYLIPMYLDRSREFVLMKSAQMGATIFVLLRIFWFALYRSVKCGFYFPTQDGVNLLSKDRLTPIVQSNQELINAVRDTDTIGYKKIGKKSALYLRHLGGLASKDSTPFDLIAFDEVRLMNALDIDQTRERISHSPYKQVIQVSTAGHPHNDIHRQFLQGTQNYWHSKCNCFPLNQTIIVRRKGSLVPEPKSLKELQSDWPWYEALSWNRHHKQWQYKGITKFHHNGTQNVIDVGFRNGAQVTVTPDHIFFQHAGQKHGRTKEMAIGLLPIADNQNQRANHISRVLIARKIPEPGTHRGFQNGRTYVQQVPYDNMTLYAVGAYIAEGSKQTETHVHFAQIEGKRLRLKVIEWADLNNLLVNENKSGVSISLASRPDLFRLFESCGVGCENKQIPNDLMRGSNHQLSVLLEGYLDGDGHKHRLKVDRRGYHSCREWECTTTSEKLKNQLLFVGLRLGTPLHQGKNKKVPKKKQSWTLTYNPNSVFNRPLLGDGPNKGALSGVSLKSRSKAGRITVGCISVADNENFVLANSGLLVHNCPDGVILSEVWPDCVAVTTDEIYYRCPRCKLRIQDPQNGRFIPHNPGADVSSYHIHQMMSKFITPAEVWRTFQTTQNIKEFYNAKLGKPYVDEENVPIREEDLIACENTDIYWGPVKSRKSQVAMGVDQMSGVNYVVIAERTPTKKRIIHFEIIDSMNSIYMEADKRITPFKRLYKLMKEFDVDMCIIDAMPNANEAMEFARAFPRRVFVSWYIDSHGTNRDIVQWGDRAKDKMNIRRGGPKIKFKYTVVMNRYLSIEFALSEIANRNCEWPHPDSLVQICRSIETGMFSPIQIMRTHFYLHMTKIIRQKAIIDENTGRFRMEWVNLGIDPHSIHSWNFCNIALERLRRQPLMTFA